jgi:hypothetical protein
MYFKKYIVTMILVKIRTLGTGILETRALQHRVRKIYLDGWMDGWMDE